MAAGKQSKMTDEERKHLMAEAWLADLDIPPNKPQQTRWDSGSIAQEVRAKYEPDIAEPFLERLGGIHNPAKLAAVCLERAKKAEEDRKAEEERKAEEGQDLQIKWDDMNGGGDCVLQ